MFTSTDEFIQKSQNVIYHLQHTSQQILQQQMQRSLVNGI